VAKIGGEAVPNRWSGNSKRTVAELGVGALKYASSRLHNNNAKKIIIRNLYSAIMPLGGYRGDKWIAKTG